MSEEASVLILGDHGPQLTNLAERVRGFGYRAIRAKTPQDAIDIAVERGFRFAAALVEVGLPAVDLAEALDELRSRAGDHQLTFLATGDTPDENERERLRSGGIQHALWYPMGDHPLLFYINRAISESMLAGHLLRESTRVPTEWKTRVTMAGRAKAASVYSLSPGGAFLATGRPSMRGAEMAIDLPLPSGPISLLGRVVYTNVPGNLQRVQLPSGMGVCFVDTPPGDQHLLSESVREVESHYFV
jgi:CheY-like chemotaxis protein